MSKVLRYTVSLLQLVFMWIISNRLGTGDTLGQCVWWWCIIETACFGLLFLGVLILGVVALIEA